MCLALAWLVWGRFIYRLKLLSCWKHLSDDKINAKLFQFELSKFNV